MASILSFTLASLLLLPSALGDGLYQKSSPVLQVDGQSYRELIEKSNYTSIVEFYAPWCGHCQNLKPAYEKAAKSLAGLAKVAAVNCDAEENKPFCGSMGVQGFPTLKIVKPGKKPGRPIVEDYQGARSAKAIVDAVIDKIPNHVKRLKDDDYQAWLEESDAPKAILFSDKGTTSALLKAVAVDFLGSISVAQIRNSEKQAVEVFSIENFPTLVLLPGDGKDPVRYEGEMKKEPIVSFLSQAAAPNPEPAPKGKKTKASSTNKSKASSASSAFSKASASHESQESQSAKTSQFSETLEDDSNPTESPHPQVAPDQKPIKLPDPAPPLSSLEDAASLQRACLNTKAGTCILALLPTSDDAANPSTTQALTSLSEIHHKHSLAKRPLFPFYQIPSANPLASTLRTALSLTTDSGIEVIAINGKRSWYRHYTKSSYTQIELEDWIDAIRMGDIPKEALPETEGLVVAPEEIPPEEPKPIKVDLNDPESMKAAGLQFEMEEIDDAAYERLVREAKEKAEAREKDKASVKDGAAEAGDAAVEDVEVSGDEAEGSKVEEADDVVTPLPVVDEHDEL